MTGIVAHTYPEWWLKLTGQAAHWSTDYSFFHYLKYKDIIENNPFNKIQTRFREPVILPKTIPLHTVEKFLATAIHQ